MSLEPLNLWAGTGGAGSHALGPPDETEQEQLHGD